MRSHGFRKFFINQCIKAGLTESTWKPLVGHKLPKTDSSYIRLTEEYLLTQYVKAIPLLTIDPTQRLQQEIRDLKVTQAQEISQQAQEIANLKSRVERQDEWLNKYHKYREESVDLLGKMKSILEENGLWPKCTANNK